MRKYFSILLFTFFIFFVQKASAHEAYVLTRSEFLHGLTTFSSNPLAPLLNPRYIGMSALITIVVVFVYIFNFLWAAMPLAALLDRQLKKAALIGPLIIRLAISSSFFYAATSNSILGPELSLQMVAGGQVIRFLLFMLSLMIFFGFFTEVAAAIGLALFFFVTATFGQYMITYANYFGELIVLFLFGSRFFAIDTLLFGKRVWWAGIEKWKFLEVPIVRMLYGIALIYAGWTIKFAHQSLSVAVYNQYHLINFFHAPAEFIAAGAGLCEIAIGFFILIGFAQRLTTLISLFFITLSILYFREMLWPHLMLYGISFSLIINSADKFTLDRYIPLWIHQRGKKK